MKIIINALSARLGGGQTYLKNLLAHLPASESLDILVFAPASLRLPDDRRIRRGTTKWPTENPLLRAVWEKAVLPRIVRKEGAEILFCPGGIVASRVPHGCKIVTMFRNMLPFDKDALSRMPFGLQKVRNIILKRVMLRSMASADLTIFISDYARSIIENLITVPRAITIPHGINEAFRTYRKILRRPEWLPAGEYLLYVSRFDVYKHQMEVALAYASLPENLRARYKLLLVGELDDVLASGVQKLIQDKQLEGQVLVAGPQAYEDLPLAYHFASANLFASSCENCPNILLEALGAGRPMLSSSIAPMPEFAGDAVEYFSPTDPDSIRKAMERVLSDEAYQERLAAASARRSEIFSWKSTSQRTWNSVLELV
ncbi:glycosyltransferase [Ralstonia pickettii]|uniref:Glycosyltransferase n=1 Tax=Ralstonia pickettii TaxID=329 RepID=A0A7X2LA23_RALPI|nr:glycosyltransferase family 1 protein [Ralstonia pickettii]MRS98704.1 glycosyltransferase [Ralstonia pickettii]